MIKFFVFSLGIWLASFAVAQPSEPNLDEANRSITFGGATQKLSPSAFRVLSFLVAHPGERFTTQQLIETVAEANDKPGRYQLVKVRRGLADIGAMLDQLSPRYLWLFRGHGFVVWHSKPRLRNETVTLKIAGKPVLSISAGLAKWRDFAPVSFPPSQEAILRALLLSTDHSLTYEQVNELFTARESTSVVSREAHSASLISMIRRKFLLVDPDFPGLTIDQTRVYLLPAAMTGGAQVAVDTVPIQDLTAPAQPSCRLALEYSDEELLQILRDRGLNVVVLPN